MRLERRFHARAPGFLAFIPSLSSDSPTVTVGTLVSSVSTRIALGSARTSQDAPSIEFVDAVVRASIRERCDARVEAVSFRDARGVPRSVRASRAGSRARGVAEAMVRWVTSAATDKKSVRRRGRRDAVAAVAGARDEAETRGCANKM